MTQAATSGPAPNPGGFALDGVALRGVVSAVPRRRVGNEAFVERFSEAAVADVVKMIGVETRHWVEDGGTASDLCQAAAETLLARLDWPADSIDALIFVSQTPDHRLPATACLLHGKLGLPTHAQAFDVNLGCSGYVYGLWLASVLIKAGLKRVLLLAGDTISRVIDPSDRGTALVFGDAGSATAVEAAPEAPAMHFRLGTDGKGAGHLIIPDGAYRDAQPDLRREAGPDPASLFMDGGEVFTFTLRAVPKLVRDTLADAGAEGDSVEAYLLHQANSFMLKHLGKKIGADGDRLPINIDRFGNTSSATLPLLLTTDMAERVTRSPTRVMLVGFGVGFSWGAALIDLAPLTCAETLYL